MTRLARLVPFLGAATSTACLAALAATSTSHADRWSALPFALMAWTGLLSAVAGLVLARGAARGAAGACAVAWCALWLLTWNEAALDAVAFVTRAVLGFVTF